MHSVPLYLLPFKELDHGEPIGGNRHRYASWLIHIPELNFLSLNLNAPFECWQVTGPRTVRPWSQSFKVPGSIGILSSFHIIHISSYSDYPCRTKFKINAHKRSRPAVIHSYSLAHHHHFPGSSGTYTIYLAVLPRCILYLPHYVYSAHSLIKSVVHRLPLISRLVSSQHRSPFNLLYSSCHTWTLRRSRFPSLSLLISFSSSHTPIWSHTTHTDIVSHQTTRYTNYHISISHLHPGFWLQSQVQCDLADLNAIVNSS